MIVYHCVYSENKRATRSVLVKQFGENRKDLVELTWYSGILDNNREEETHKHHREEEAVCYWFTT
jgi:hypothetical protein